MSAATSAGALTTSKAARAAQSESDFNAGNAKSRLAVALWEAGDRRCGLCGGQVAGFGEPVHRRGIAPTIEHVLPRNPRADDADRVGRWREFLRRFSGRNAFGSKNNRLVIAHGDCNTRKGNRPPWGCEVVFLMAVNARLEPKESGRA